MLVTAYRYLGTKRELLVEAGAVEEERKEEQSLVLGCCTREPHLESTLPWTSHLQDVVNYRLSLKPLRGDASITCSPKLPD